MNLYKTSDIKISSDSMGAISADHKYQGRLIDSSMFWASSQAESRKIGRRAAVQELKCRKIEKELAA
tara:strand:- start:114 stop:314 length:201 start_codon:yes stop_codon:yes gene_type:complete